MAPGIGGQRVLIMPALDLVVVMNAGLYKSPLQAQTSVVTAIRDRFVLKAVASHP
jgi:hypothetical protein